MHFKCFGTGEHVLGNKSARDDVAIVLEFRSVLRGSGAVGVHRTPGLHVPRSRFGERSSSRVSRGRWSSFRTSAAWRSWLTGCRCFTGLRSHMTRPWCPFRAGMGPAMMSWTSSSHTLSACPREFVSCKMTDISS